MPANRLMCLIIKWKSYTSGNSNRGKLQKNSSTIGPLAGMEPMPVRLVYNFHSILRKFSTSSEVPKIITIYPQPICRRYHPKYTFIKLAPISCLRTLVVRAVHQHRTGSIPARGPIVDEFFSTVPG